MGFMKFASTQVLSVERETDMSRTASAAGFSSTPTFETLQTQAGVKQAHRAHFDYERRPGYIYVRSRAISSRCNDNYDEFPAEEIKTAYRTFIGKPVFVNHHNDDHRRARGAIIDAALHEDTNPDGTPDTWVEVLMEVDAKRFPTLAREILKGNIARTSMGTNVEYSICTACGNKAYSPVEYCQHIPRMKGMKIRRANAATGAQEEVLIAERCFGLGFFENSLLVEDPADPTAFAWVDDPNQVTASRIEVTAKGKDTRVPPSEHGDPRMQDKGVSVSRTPSGKYYVHTHRARSKYYDSVADIPQKDIDYIRSTGAVDALCSDCFESKYGFEPGMDPEVAGWKPGQCSQCGKDGIVFTLNPDLQAHAAVEYERHTVKSQDIQVGDRLDSSGRTRVSGPLMRRHDGWLAQTKTRGARSPNIRGWEHDQDVHVWRPKSKTAKSFAPISSGEGLHKGLHVWAQPVQDDVMSAKPARVVRDYDGKSFRVKFEHSGYEHDVSDDDLRNGNWKIRHASRRGAWIPTDQEMAAFEAALHTAIGEVKAPAKVDTMRDERCPVCRDDEAFDGDRCGICGYVTPPEMFRDPDLTKAQEVDLRQDALEEPDAEGNMQVGVDEAEGDVPTMQCDSCGEEFGADAEGVDPTDADQAQEADGDPAGDPTQPDRAQAPDDLSDLADKTDKDLGLEEDEPDASEDPLEAESPVEQDPDQSGGVTDLDEETSVSPGDLCPICGQGTIVTIAPDPDPTGEGNDPKETSRDMTDQQITNPAKKARNRLVNALLEQQRQITALRSENSAMKALVFEIGKAAGLEHHPRFAALKTAGDTNDQPEGTPATTSQEARQPDATDDVNSVGAAPGGANVNVTPKAVTDVQSTDKVDPGNQPLQNLVDVTAPTPGADNVPAPGDGDKVINPVTVGTPSQQVMDPPGSTGWTASAKVEEEDPMQRHTASLRLARLRIAAGLVRGEDLSVGEAIYKDASLSLSTIVALTHELGQTLAVGQQSQPTRAQAQRLVPRSVQASRAPSLGGDPIEVTAASDGRGMDEWAVGLDSLSTEE